MTTAAGRLRRAAPAGEPIGPAALWRVLRQPDPGRALRAGLRALVERPQVALFASGREALRVGLAGLAADRGRDEVVIPAYTCFSVAASAVAAGLRVRLVDVDEAGRIATGALAALPLERAAAVVVCNLFGLAEPLAPVARLAEAAGAATLDDAAQALGARGAEGPVGGRGTLGVLSFARGKPLAALGGGALVWDEAFAGAAAPALPAPRRLRALARACAYDVARSSWVFPWLERLPGLGIGQTVFDPGFARGGLDGAALALAAAQVATAAQAGRARAAAAEALAARIRAETDFRPLLAAPGEQGVYPRLALRARSAADRDRALAALRARGLGASAFYPSALDALAPLAPHRVEGAPCPGARALAAELLTLAVPRGARAREALLEALVAASS